MADLFDLGFDKTLQRAEGPLQDLIGLPSGQLVAPPNSQQVQAERILSGAVDDVLFSGKRTFSDTSQGFMQGIDRADGEYKWVLGSSYATFDFGVTSPGVFYVNLPADSGATNAFFINAASNSGYPAIDVRRSVGTGTGIYVHCASPSGVCFDAENASDTASIRGKSTATSGSNVVPIQLENQLATSTNYWKIANYRGGSTPTVTVNQWVGSTSPNGVLDGDQGDFLQSSAGKVYVNTDGSTTWNELLGSTTGILPVASGGTGKSSFTAYAVICGGTTTTSALQSVASVGTSGQVLTSNGAGALPTFQAVSAAFPIVDSTEVIMGSADSTKRIRFEVDGLTASTTRVLTVPDADGTMTLLGNDYTGANKVVLDTSPTIVTPTVTGDITCSGTFISSDQFAVDCGPYGTGAGETGSVIFKELAANGTNYIAFKAADSMTASTTYVWPSAAGSAGEVLQISSGTTLTWGYGIRIVHLKVTNDSTSVTVADDQIQFCIPEELNGMDLVNAHAYVTTASSSGALTIQIANTTDAVDMLSTEITIDQSELTSYTAATAPVIDTGNDGVATGDLIAVDVDGAGTGAKGLGVYLTFR